jgi:hypothetical protein
MTIIAVTQERAGTIFFNAQRRAKDLTAVEALEGRGSCTSCAKLVAALLRACNIPARVVAGYPSWTGPLQAHYIVEAYVPDFVAHQSALKDGERLEIPQYGPPEVDRVRG